MSSSKVVISGSSIAGRGLFATRRIRKNEVVIPVEGPVIHFDFKHNSRMGPHWINIAKDEWVMPMPHTLFRYLNHSCDPNIGWGAGGEFVAMRTIEAGEEVVIDYSCTESLPDWKMKCSCGAQQCRKVIRSIQMLPDDLFQKYRQYIPSFLQKIYREQKFYFLQDHKDNGIFAKQFLKRGTRIFTVQGPVVHYPFQPHFRVGPKWLCVGDRSWVIPLKNNPWRFMNHSCQPNTGLVDKNVVVALRNIHQDEELTIDDSITEADPHWHKQCNCGTAACRGVVRSIQFLPQEVYRKYLPFVPEYLQKKRQVALG